jgi:hypothetical protein
VSRATYRDRLERMRLAGRAGSATSRSERLPVIGKRAADISLKRGEIKCDPLISEINANGPEPLGVARRPCERSRDGDAITHRMTRV